MAAARRNAPWRWPRNCVSREAVTLVDLDFVNPYFRALDHRQALEELGVRVVAPAPEIAAIDAPALPPAARDAIVHPGGRTLVDLGGDPAGATVIAQFAPALTRYDLWAVVNFCRPTTADPAQAAVLLQEIADTTRLHLTGLISNTHLGAETTPEDVLGGLEQARILSCMLSAPDRTPLRAGLADPAAMDIPLLPIAPRLKRPWEK